MKQDDFIWAGWIAVVITVSLVCYGAGIAYELLRGPHV